MYTEEELNTTINTLQKILYQLRKEKYNNNVSETTRTEKQKTDKV